MDTIRHSRPFLSLQLLATLVILFLLPHTLLQAVLLLLVWSLFLPLTADEWVLVLISCVFYTGADLLTIHSGIFRFTHPDLWQIPQYEFFVWGFYFLHTKRILNDTPWSQRGLWYIGYLSLLGIIVEYLGTSTGQWFYFIPSPLSLLWRVCSWAASGIFLYYVLLPLSTFFAHRMLPRR